MGKRTFQSEKDELYYLRKENKRLKHQVGDLRKELKVDIKAERQRCFKEGYATAEALYNVDNPASS